MSQDRTSFIQSLVDVAFYRNNATEQDDVKAIGEMSLNAHPEQAFQEVFAV